MLLVGMSPRDSAALGVLVGFALKGWRSWEMKNVAMQLRGDTAIAMGNLVLTDKNGKTTTVDKTATMSPNAIYAEAKDAVGLGQFDKAVPLYEKLEARAADKHSGALFAESSASFMLEEAGPL